MKTTYPPQWEGVLLRLLVAMPGGIAVMYAWQTSTSYLPALEGIVGILAAVFLLVRPWETAGVLLPALLFFLVIHGAEHSWTVGHTLSCAFLSVVLLRVIWWWWGEATHRDNGTEDDTTTVNSTGRFKFGLAGMLWFLALVSVIGAFVAEAEKWQVEQANYRLLRGRLRTAGARWELPIRGGQVISFYGTLPSEKALIAYLNDCVRANRPTSKLDFGEQPVTDTALEYIGKLDGLFYLDLHGTKITDEGVRHLANLELSYLNLSDTSVSDAALGNLPALNGYGISPYIGYLDLSGTNITDAGVESLAGLKGLWQLDISDTNVTDASLITLAQCDLYRLDLSGTKVSGAGLPHLGKMENLIWLTLNRTALTDEDIHALAQLQNVTNLVLCDTSLSDTALDRLEELMPNTKIWRTPPPE